MSCKSWWYCCYCCVCCTVRTAIIVAGGAESVLCICGIYFIYTGIHLNRNLENENWIINNLEIILAYLIVSITCNIILVYGAFTRSKWYLLPWMVYNGIGIGSLTVYLIYFKFPISELVLWVGLGTMWINILNYFCTLNQIGNPTTIIITDEPEVINLQEVIIHQPTIPDDNESFSESDCAVEGIWWVLLVLRIILRGCFM